MGCGPCPWSCPAVGNTTRVSPRSPWSCVVWVVKYVKSVVPGHMERYVRVCQDHVSVGMGCPGLHKVNARRVGLQEERRRDPTSFARDGPKRWARRTRRRFSLPPRLFFPFVCVCVSYSHSTSNENDHTKKEASRVRTAMGLLFPWFFVFIQRATRKTDGPPAGPPCNTYTHTPWVVAPYHVGHPSRRSCRPSVVLCCCVDGGCVGVMSVQVERPAHHPLLPSKASRKPTPAHPTKSRARTFPRPHGRRLCVLW